MASSRPGAGDEIPNLSLTTLSGSSLKLHDLRGVPIWLAIFRFAACPFCARRVHQLSIDCDRFEALGLKILAVFPSRPGVVERYVAKFRVPFEIICDPEEVVYSTLGITSSVAGTLRSTLRPSHLVEGLRLTGLGAFRSDGSKFRMPADFLIDRELRIADAYYATEADDGIPLERVEQFAAQQRAHRLPEA